MWRIPTAPGSLINSYAMLDGDGSVTLIDCGIDKAPPRIVAGLEAMGKHPSDVTRIVLAHVHPDHVGGAAAMAELTGAEVTAHQADSQYAAAGHPPISDGSFQLGRMFNRVAKGKFRPVDIANPLTDGQLLDVAGGVRVLHTPGHSPDHISLLHESSKVLMTGDALFNVLSLRWSPRFLCNDFAMTQRSAQVFAEVEHDVAAFTHGSEITDQPREKIRRFLARR